jgi:hypothetical protein
VKLLGRLAPWIEEVRADALTADDTLAAGRYQPYELGEVDPAGEHVLKVDRDEDLIYVWSCGAPDDTFSLAPDQVVMVDRRPWV